MEQGTGLIETLPTGIDLLDTIMGGGFGVGTYSMIVGNPGTFKSSLLGQVIGTSQTKYRGKLLASYLDSETTMTKQRLFELGVKFPPITPYPKISIEKMFKTIECHCMYKTLKEIINIPSVVGWDSVANTATEQELQSETDDINKFIGLRARVLSLLLPKYIHKMSNYNVSLIAVNQLRDKMDLGQFAQANDIRWLGSKTIPGGNALKFNAFHLLLLVVRGDLKYEQYGFNGIKLEIKCLKNKLFTPNIPVTLLVDFNTGISNFWTNYNFLVDTKRLQSGAWNKLICLPDFKFRTKDALNNYNTDETFKKAFDEQVQEALKTEFLDKYNNYNEIESE